MSETCTHDCSSCKSNCDHRAPQHEPPHARSRIQKVIGVVSGKGGVGKSMTSAMLAVSMRRLGFKAGVLDADITGPSIPRLFGVKGPATGDGESINPVSSRTGVEIMSINLLLDDPEAPVVWRGPVIAGAVKQFWQEVVWDVDFLFVDMPPGTGDVPLTVFQTLPVDGIVVVASPQELVSLIDPQPHHAHRDGGRDAGQEQRYTVALCQPARLFVDEDGQQQRHHQHDGHQRNDKIERIAEIRVKVLVVRERLDVVLQAQPVRLAEQVVIGEG